MVILTINYIEHIICANFPTEVIIYTNITGVDECLDAINHIILYALPIYIHYVEKKRMYML
jgi:hypothetical protein